MKSSTKSFLLAASALCLLTNLASATLITKFNGTPGVFDSSSGTRAFTFFIAESGGTISDVDISIRFGKHDGQTFGVNPGGTPYYNEIVFSLTGNVIGTDPTSNLISANSWSAGNGGFLDRTITFDESASSAVNSGFEPVAGTFRTTGFAGGSGLDQFNGLILEAGSWTLYIQDTVGADALDFISAELKVTTPSVPDGGTTLALLGGALTGLGALRRKLRR
jgi:hypothetical protein